MRPRHDELFRPGWNGDRHMNPWAFFLGELQPGSAGKPAATKTSVSAVIDTVGETRRRSGLDLKWTLVGRIVLMAMLCLIGGAALTVRHVAAEVDRRNDDVVEAVERQLMVQIIRITRGFDRADRFPDWESVLKFSLGAGQCIQLLGPVTEVRNASCVGSDERVSSPPAWFVTASHALFVGRSQTERRLVYRGESWGTIRATLDPTTIARTAWMELTRTLGLLVMTIGALCVLVYVVVDHALRPAAEVLAGVNRLSDGDLSSRLPSFRLRELQRIADVFNDLAQSLQATTSERAEFARRLVDAQERERRMIALELHDDIAQRLTALSCLATSISKTVRATAPEAAQESQELVALASGTMRALRETLAHLRPPELDDLGLIASLQALTACHARQGSSAFVFQWHGCFDDVPAEAAGHIYRIVQEALNNAARHAAAANVEVLLRGGPVSASRTGERARLIALSVTDDGVGLPPAASSGSSSGVGLVGMRERVVALGGAFSLAQRLEGGVELRVSFSVPLEPREQI